MFKIVSKEYIESLEKANSSFDGYVKATTEYIENSKEIIREQEEHIETLKEIISLQTELVKKEVLNHD